MYSVLNNCIALEQQMSAAHEDRFYHGPVTRAPHLHPMNAKISVPPREAV